MKNKIYLLILIAFIISCSNTKQVIHYLARGGNSTHSKIMNVKIIIGSQSYLV